MAVSRAGVLVTLLLTASACGERAPPEPTAVSAVSADAGPVDHTSLIPRSLLFGDPTRIRARYSPDGALVSWLAPVDGALNIWVAPADAPDQAQPITDVGSPGVSYYDWARDDTHILFAGPSRTSQRSHVMTVDAATGVVADLTPGEGVNRAEVVAASWDYPDKIIIAADAAETDRLDLYEVNIVTGASRLIFENTAGFTRFHFDPGLRLRAAERPTEAGGLELLALDNQGWRRVSVFTPEDAAQFQLLAIDRGGRTATVIDSTGRDYAALSRLDMMTGERTVIGAVDGADVANVLFHPATFQPEAFSVARLSEDWLPLTSDIAAALQTIEDEVGGDLRILSRTLDDRLWIVYTWAAGNPGTYYAFDRETDTVTHLLDIRPQMVDRAGFVRTPVVLQTDEGVEMTAFLSLPRGADQDGDGRPDEPAPFLVMPISAPGHRWGGGYDDRVDWLSDRGYAVLAVNTRGASGAGKAFLEAGLNDWAGAVQRDIRGAADWAVERGLADPDRIGLFASGLGGVTALRALAIDGDRFSCGVALATPLDMAGFLEAPPPYLRAHARRFRRAVSDPLTPEDAAAMEALSPLSVAEEIASPVLLINGGLGDPVMEELAVAFADAVAGPVTLAMFPADNLSLAQPPDRVAFAAAVETFLGECLGGAVEPAGEAYARSAMRFFPTADQSAETASEP